MHTSRALHCSLCHRGLSMARVWASSVSIRASPQSCLRLRIQSSCLKFLLKQIPMKKTKTQTSLLGAPETKSHKNKKTQTSVLSVQQDLHAVVPVIENQVSFPCCA